MIYFKTDSIFGVRFFIQTQIARMFFTNNTNIFDAVSAIFESICVLRVKNIALKTQIARMFFSNNTNSFGSLVAFVKVFVSFVFKKISKDQYILRLNH
ncbi:hypothetical protein SAMN02787100_1663 [Chryseobacterium sp. OV279]|nr:hypothetical protein SAMN02787100_1663 [Chryseobacterium sp. OV279]